jgi:predicted dehydrogenase
MAVELSQAVPRSRYALIGAGHRAQTYVDALIGGHRGAGELVALCDPNRTRIAYYQDLVAQALPDEPAVPGYPPERFEELVLRHRPDAVIITTVDRLHAQYIGQALDLGCAVISEKPLTIDVEGCQQIVDAVDRTGGEVTVTFNYRYSPRNSAVKRLLLSGAIGDVTSVHFEWVLDTVHGADYFRRWHRNKSDSGGLLVHKSTHHFDLVNWWLDDVPQTVFAAGGLRFYGARNAAQRGLGRRPRRSHGDPGLADDPFGIDLAADPRLRRLYLDAEGEDGYLRDLDVFSEGITIEDNLAVLAQYERGAVLSYSLNAHSPWEGYRVCLNGTRGRLELEVCERPWVGAGSEVDASATGAGASDGASGQAGPGARGGGPDGPAADPVRHRGDRLILQRHWQPAELVDIEALARQDLDRPPRPGAHGGGDLLLLDDLFLGPDHAGPDPLNRAAGYLDGVRGVLVGAAANLSLSSGRPVQLADLGVRMHPQPVEVG